MEEAKEGCAAGLPAGERGSDTADLCREDSLLGSHSKLTPRMIHLMGFRYRADLCREDAL